MNWYKKAKKYKDKRFEGEKLDTQLLCCGYPENKRKDPYKKNKEKSAKKIESQQQLQIGDTVEILGYKGESPGKIFKDNGDGTFGVNTQTRRPMVRIPVNQLKLIIPNNQKISPQQPILNKFFQIGQLVNILQNRLLSPGKIVKDNGDGTYLVNDKFGKSIGNILGNELQSL